MAAEVGQYVAYTFFKADPAWRRLPVDERVAGKDAFADVIEAWAERFTHLRVSAVAAVNPGTPSLVRAVVRPG